MRLCALWICVACAAAGGAACGSDDANAAGDYTISLTDRDNACNLGNWTVGATSTATVTLTQSSNNVTAVVTGLGAVVLDLGLGGHSYSGKIDGTTLELDLLGTRSNTSGNCTYTLNSKIHAVLDGDTITGQIDYTSATNGNPDCTAIAGCVSFQDFTGSRPPR